MASLVLRWGSILGFSVLVGLSFVLYGLVFEQIGDPPDTVLSLNTVRYLVTAMFHPYFIIGMGLALTAAFVRLFIFSYVGIAQTALVSEFTLVMSVAFAVAIFDSSLEVKEYVGMFLIMIGVYLVQSQGTI